MITLRCRKKNHLKHYFFCFFLSLAQSFSFRLLLIYRQNARAFQFTDKRTVIFCAFLLFNSIFCVCVCVEYLCPMPLSFININTVPHLLQPHIEMKRNNSLASRDGTSERKKKNIPPSLKYSYKL